MKETVIYLDSVKALQIQGLKYQNQDGQSGTEWEHY